MFADVLLPWVICNMHVAKTFVQFAIQRLFG